MKYYRYLLFAAIIFVIQIGFFSNISLTKEILILPVATFFLALYAPLEVCIIFSTAVGFFYDISTLQRIPFLTVFLLAEILVIVIAKKHIVNFSSVLGRIIGIFFVICAYQLLKAIIFYQAFQLGLLWVTLINLIFAFIMFELIYRYRKNFFNL